MTHQEPSWPALPGDDDSADHSETVIKAVDDWTSSVHQDRRGRRAAPARMVRPNRSGSCGCRGVGCPAERALHGKVIMRVVLAALLTTLPAVFVRASPAQAADGAAGIQVRDGRLVEATGSDLVLRGVNHDFMWYPDKNSSFAAVKAAGANAVRIPLGIGHQWRASHAQDVTTVVGLCRENRLICVLDAHDTTGFGQDPKAATMAEAVRFWIGVRDALIGQEDYVIINIANEPFGNGTTMPWAEQTSDAIRQLRAAGFKHTLMVDAPGWGQDESFVMRDNAKRVIAADPSGDTIFDVHMYGQFATASKVRSYLGSFTSRRLPIVIGEFSSQHQWGDPDEDAIMASAQEHHLGATVHQRPQRTEHRHTRGDNLSLRCRCGRDEGARTRATADHGIRRDQRPRSPELAAPARHGLDDDLPGGGGERGDRDPAAHHEQVDRHADRSEGINRIHVRGVRPEPHRPALTPLGARRRRDTARTLTTNTRALMDASRRSFR